MRNWSPLPRGHSGKRHLPTAATRPRPPPSPAAPLSVLFIHEHSTCLKASRQKCSPRKNSGHGHGPLSFLYTDSKTTTSETELNCIDVQGYSTRPVLLSSNTAPGQTGGPQWERLRQTVLHPGRVWGYQILLKGLMLSENLKHLWIKCT